MNDEGSQPDEDSSHPSEETDNEQAGLERTEQPADWSVSTNQHAGTDREPDAGPETEQLFSYSPEDDSDQQSDSTADSDGNVAGSLEALEPLEPQSINAENAFFVLLGVLLVVGFLVGALVGL